MTKALTSFGKIFLSCLLVFTLILTGVYAFFEFYFKNNWAKIVKEQIVKNTGLSVEFNQVRFSFLSFIKLNPSLVIEDIKVGEALTIDKFYIEAKLKSLLKEGKISISELNPNDQKQIKQLESIIGGKLDTIYVGGSERFVASIRISPGYSAYEFTLDIMRKLLKFPITHVTGGHDIVNVYFK